MIRTDKILWVDGTTEPRIQENVYFIVDQSFILNPIVNFNYAPSDQKTETVFINGISQAPNSYVLDGEELEFIDNNFKVGDSVLIKYWRNK